MAEKDDFWPFQRCAKFGPTWSQKVTKSDEKWRKVTKKKAIVFFNFFLPNFINRGCFGTLMVFTSQTYLRICHFHPQHMWNSHFSVVNLKILQFFLKNWPILYGIFEAEGSVGRDKQGQICDRHGDSFPKHPNMTAKDRSYCLSEPHKGGREIGTGKKRKNGQKSTF